MVTPRRRRSEARLRERFWADLQHDRTATPPEGLDPTIADVVRLDRAAPARDVRGVPRAALAAPRGAGILAFHIYRERDR